MKFFDKVELKFQSWIWWDWAVAWRREKYVPYWWPSGWDWGKWGDIILRANKNENTLQKVRYKTCYKAENWEQGEGKDKFWKDGSDIVLDVPVGTVVKESETWKLLWQLIKDQETLLVTKWWKWGRWNINFKTSTRQYPTFALKWEPWEKKELILELQILADIAFVWTPSVWKSTIINSISNVKAKIGNYDFTTLVPNIWILEYKSTSWTLIDIPGLIEWANVGKGLWNEFLRHILKAKILTFVLDLGRYEEWLNDFEKLFEEIKLYVNRKLSKENSWYEIFSEVRISWEDLLVEFYSLDSSWEKTILLRKMIYFVFNKYDKINDEQILREYMSLFRKKLNQYLGLKITKKFLDLNSCIISAATFYWRDKLVDKIYKKIVNFSDESIQDFYKFNLQKIQYKESYIKDITDKELDYLVSNDYIENNTNIKVREISDAYLTYLCFVLPWWNKEAELWFRDKIKKTWYMNIWQKKWIRIWDVLKIKSFYKREEDKYILFE